MGALELLDLCGLIVWGGWYVHRHWHGPTRDELDRRFARRHRIDL